MFDFSVKQSYNINNVYVPYGQRKDVLCVAEKKIRMTKEGKIRLEEELDILKTTGRTEVAEKIKQARSFGDLSENSEYDEAKDEQAKMEARIVEIENMLKNAEIIDDSTVDTKVISLGSKVKLLDIEFNEEVEYAIVGSTEADAMKNKVSEESPMGKALMGMKKGKTITVSAPAGEFQYKILSISR